MATKKAKRKPAKAAAKKSVRKSVKKSVKKAGKKPTAASKSVASALPRPSTKPWGKAGRALDGVRILDFTHVQSGPTCTQLLGYMGADCIKVERPGVGDITRGQLRDVKGADSLYFTMLNGNKRSITIDSKHPKGKEILDRLIKYCDVLVENFAPGALDRMGLTWEHVHKLNPRMIVASVKGFGPGPYEDCKVYENVAQCAGGAASTTGFREGPPLVTGAQIGDSGTGLHLAFGIVSALYQRMRTGRASSCATSSACRTGRSPSSASTARESRSARQCRAPATIRAVASRDGFSNARAGRAIPTPTSISSPRRRSGARSAI
jgi:formyl-CoA transferase